MTALEVLPYIVLCAVLFVACFSFAEICKRQTVVAHVVQKSRERMQREKEGLTTFENAFGAGEKQSLFQRLDRMFLMSGIRSMSSTVYYGITLVAGFAALVLGTVLFKLVLGLFLFAASLVVSYIILSVKSGKRYMEIEKNTPMFLAVMANYSKGSSDIITIMKQVENKLNGTLHQIVHDFITNADVYGETDIAFDIAKESVENYQFRIILMNLKTCSHYEANYEVVLEQMLQQSSQELTAREERRAYMVEGKVTVALIAVITGVIVLMIGHMLNIDSMKVMLANPIGQGILLIQGIIYLFVLAFLFSTDKSR
jgi:Flp pilus assembly protein TadB